jgi:hypothetical protein
MKRKATDSAEAVDYPSFDDYHANRRDFLKKLGISAAALVAGCRRPGVRTGGVMAPPFEELGGEPPAPPIEAPPEEIDGDMAVAELPGSMVQPEIEKPPAEMIVGDIVGPIGPQYEK